MSGPAASTPAPTPLRYSVVIPTIGRPSLRRLLAALASSRGPDPDAVIIVDDRRRPESPLELPDTGLAVRVLAGGHGGPAAARNLGWRAAAGEWVAFLDDDVVPEPDWRGRLAADLTNVVGPVAGSQGRLQVPRPDGRRPTDWERNVAGLEHARWATADIAYRTTVLEEVGGFDERFPRAFREDADLGLRISDAGYLIVQGERRAVHPVRPADRWVSLRLQAGNADDVLMRARHGAGWRERAGSEPGRTGRHLLTTLSASCALIGASRRSRALTLMGTAGWLTGTAELTAVRVRPGPRTADEVATMVLTSAALPAVASLHWLIGWGRLPALCADRKAAPLGLTRSPLALNPPPVFRRQRRTNRRRADHSWQAAAILFDRDGTLIVDRPGNTDPERLALMPGARMAVRRARSAGLAVGVVTNQSIIGRGRASRAEVDRINRAVDDWVGPFDTWQVCPHHPEDGCGCRKPAPGMINAAATALGVSPSRCAVIGDIGSDMGAAAGAGARGVLVPTRTTRPSEIQTAPVVAPDILSAVDLVLAGMC